MPETNTNSSRIFDRLLSLAGKILLCFEPTHQSRGGANSTFISMPTRRIFFALSGAKASGVIGDLPFKSSWDGFFFERPQDTSLADGAVLVPSAKCADNETFRAAAVYLSLLRGPGTNFAKEVLKRFGCLVEAYMC